MASQNRGRSAHRSVPEQIDLFVENASAANGILAWSGLPREMQAALTTLILDHEANRRIASQNDGHDL